MNMTLPSSTIVLGPVRYKLNMYARGNKAQTSAIPWFSTETGIPLENIELQRDEHGRPNLVAPADYDLNWSHSGSLLLMAYGQNIQLGVDIEFLRPRAQALTLAQRYYTTSEAESLAQLPEEDMQQAFIHLWCIKEAILKAHGRGIAFGLKRLQFEYDHIARQWRFQACDPALGIPADWHLHSFIPAAQYYAVIAWKKSSRSHPTSCNA